MPGMERASVQAVTSPDGTAAEGAGSTGGGSTQHAGARNGDTAGPGAESGGTAHVWRALGGEEMLLERVLHTYRHGTLPARLPVRELARSTVAACALAAAELSAVRASSSHVPAVRVDDGAVAAAFTSERHLLIDGRAPVNFAPLSRFWRTADGWVRTHANYPHHRARLLAALSLPERGEDAGTLSRKVGALLAERAAEEVQESVQAASGLAVAVRSPEDWSRHPHGAAVAKRPLLSVDTLDSAPPLPWTPDAGNAAGLPLAGVRVLDLTRVISGPVATRTLALLGADVLRVDSPALPEFPHAHADTGFGKRSAGVDLGSRSGQAAFEELLSSAHVVLTGYRPGSLDRFGLAPESLTDRRPGLVVGQLSAWGCHGPWHRRRGFDSIVQAATGIALTEQSADGSPGALPAQALDHGTGYLLAAAVLRSLTDQQQSRPGSRVVRLSLAQTAHWLQHVIPHNEQHSEQRPSTRENGAQDSGTDDVQQGDAYDPAHWLTECDSALGRLRHARPPVGFDGGPVNWQRPPGLPATDAPVW